MGRVGRRVHGGCNTGASFKGRGNKNSIYKASGCILKENYDGFSLSLVDAKLWVPILGSLCCVQSF